MNGVVKAANKNIKKIVQKMIITYKDWRKMLLPYALHGYITIIQISRGEILCSLIYGMEAEMPQKIKIPSLRVLKEV
jgi:hypothetical protein